MQRFRFRLENVLDWRRVHLELEETKLQRLFEDLRAIERAGVRLEQEKAEAEKMVLGAGSVEAADLVALESYRAHVAREKVRPARERGACERRIAEQRECVLKAERDVRLLEKLRERRLAEWQTESDREQEALVGELFLGRWHRK